VRSDLFKKDRAVADNRLGTCSGTTLLSRLFGRITLIGRGHAMKDGRSPSVVATPLVNQGVDTFQLA
jgi:hypothetical protein